MKLIAICIFGIESVLSRELRNLGIETDKISNGRIEFSGDFETIARANLWLRTAERIYINAGTFPANSFDELYDRTALLPWEDFISQDGRMAIRSSNINSKLFSQRDCQRIVKKSIIDRLSKKYGITTFPEDGPEYKIEVFIHNDMAELNIDTSGTGLHKRGYRTLNVEAPLKETIAAALIGISYWRPGRLFLDPFCGSGTFPIEAAMVAANIAPGLKRDFLFEKWTNKNKQIMLEEKTKARTRIRKNPGVRIYGRDISHGNIKIARKHAAAAGVAEMIDFKQEDAVEATQPGEYGVMICNPPYGLRISDKTDVQKLYRDMGDMFRRFETWSKYVLTDSGEFESTTGIRANKRRKIYNGTISCTYYQYFGPKPL